MSRSLVSPEEFIDAWRASSSIDDVCQRTGMKRDTVIIRASRYRQNGVALKRFKADTALDYEALNRRAVGEK